MILAGGKGERLYPLTQDRAKPAVPFGGIYRIIDFTLSNCLNSGIRRIDLLTQYKSLSLNRHIFQGWNIFNPQLNEFINLIPAQQRVGEDWYLGTADAIYQNIYVLQQDRPDLILILSGDHIYKMNYREMIAHHLEKKADLTAAVIEMDRNLSRQFGVLQVDEEFRIIEDAKNPDSQHDFGRNVIPAMVGQDRVYAYSFRDENRKQAKYWRDIGTLDAYYEASMDLVAVDPQFNLYDSNWPIRTYYPPLPPAKTVFEEHDSNRVGVSFSSIVSSGCIISGGRVYRSILSPNVRIHSYSEVQDSILMEGVDVGRGARVRRAIIDKRIRVPAGFQIGFNLEEDARKFTVTQSGVVVISKGTILA
jgi:glucose-1-phosphate adenylyltransferase